MKKLIALAILMSGCYGLAQAPTDANPPNPAITIDETAQQDALQPERSRSLVNGGSMEAPLRNVLTSGVSVNVAADSNPMGMVSNPEFDLMSHLSGFVNLTRDMRFQHFQLSYEGGGTLYKTHSEWDSHFHHAGLSYAVTRRKWLLNVREEVDYSPSSPTGSERVTSSDGISGSTTGLGPNDVPNQSILGPLARQLNNTTAGQLDVYVSPRNTLTFTGSYGLLRIVDNDFLDSAQANTSAGFVHRFGRANRAGAIYTYGFYRYDSIGTTVYSESAVAYFARELGRRLLVQVSVGPQFSHSTVPGTDDTGIAVDTTANWVTARNNFSLGYFRGITGGSGLLASAQTDSVSAGFSRHLARRWSMSSTFTYSMNEATAVASIIQPGARTGAYTATIGRFEVARELARGNRMFVRYSALKGGRAICSTTGCTTDELRHVVEFGFDWRFRPIRIR